MCMSIEYHLYLLHFFYHANDYNLFIIFVFMFMGGSMSAVMLLLCYLPSRHAHFLVLFYFTICIMITLLLGLIFLSIFQNTLGYVFLEPIDCICQRCVPENKWGAKRNKLKTYVEKPYWHTLRE